MAQTPPNTKRPLSPHLQVYRWPLGMAMSIMHRITGAALAVGLLMVTWMLLAAATGPAAWDLFQNFVRSGLGMLMLFGWSLALFYHMSNGVRHLIWDTVHLFKLENAKRSSLVVLLCAAALTVVFWCAACPWKGE